MFLPSSLPGQIGVTLLVLIGSCSWLGCNRGASTKPPTPTTSANPQADVAPSANVTDIQLQNQLRSKPSPKAGPLFEELSAEQTGIDFVQRLAPDHPLAYLYHSGYSCGGVCLGDVNGDGLADIFLASGPDANALFVNRGGMRFERSAWPTTAFGTWSTGASMLDVDGDGDLDVFVCNYDAANSLWINEGTDDAGHPQFREVANAAGLDFAGASHCPYFSDFDGDGDLDLFLLTNRIYSPTGRPRGVASELGPDGQPRIKEEFAKYFRVVRPAIEAPPQDPKTRTPGPFMLELGHEDRLYRNDGDGPSGVPKFKDVTHGSGIDGVIGHGLSALVWDVNGDHLLDIYVANDYSDPDKFWINQGPDANGRLRFVDRTEQFVPYTAWSAMGSDLADVNGDGRFDFMVADMAATTHFKAKSTMGEMTGWRRWILENDWPRQAMRNMLYVDSGKGRFWETAFFSDVGSSDWTWSVKFADFDLDGRNDLYLTNGTARVFSDSDINIKPQMFVGQTEWEIFRDKPQNRERNLAFRNTGDLRFQDVSSTWSLDKEGMSYGAATGDLDNDGDLDLVVCNLDDPISIYRNRAAGANLHWLRIRLQGQGKNRFGWGAQVTVTLPSGDQLVRMMNPQRGFLSVNEPVLHFGLGEADRVQAVEVRWPGGAAQELGPQDGNQLLVVAESLAAKKSTAENLEPLAQPSTFETTKAPTGLDFRHRETVFNDYDREFLLPGKLSQLGPGVAVADVNRDGRDDVFVGGAAEQAGVLFLQQQDNSFHRAANMPWDDHAASEDMGALFFDADRDGDLDLYVVHGSNEFPVGDPRYTDQLYRNDTTPALGVRFSTCSPDTLELPRASGSCVVGADFDGDGDVDLFVGARSVPGQYPLSPRSTLLRNDGNQAGNQAGNDAGKIKFVDVTDSLAPGLAESGLVTSAIWSDVDQDGWLDLMVTNEWGPVRLFQNAQGSLREITNSTELAARLGWWNSIVGGDFDRDGDIDYATMNVGFNTKYGRPSQEKPTILYRGDMDGNGTDDLVEAKSSKSGELPVRGRSCSCNAMPLLRQKFPTYKQFALASLEGIYSDNKLEDAKRFAATEFASGIWWNESSPGKVSLLWQALPTSTQLSPGFGAAVADFTNQNLPVLVVSQNHFTREPETGLWRGGLGTMTHWESERLKNLPLKQTGFSIDGDGKGLAIADLNGDHRPDLIAAQNDDVVKVFQSRANGSSMPLAVQLQGPAGNPLGFGARVQLLEGQDLLATTEVHGGSGYLSQSSPTVFLSRPSASQQLSVRVRWPDGDISQEEVTDRSVMRIKKP